MSEAKASNPFPSGRAFRVLIVEDDAAEAGLAVSVLERAGYPLAFEIIGSAADFERRLAHSDYDAILCNPNLRTLTGMQALEILKRSGKDIPFLALARSLGDEAGVEYVQRGATDYLLKDRLEQLPVALSRALRDKARREETAKLQEQIARAKRDWELTFDSVPDPILLVNEECSIQRANRALGELVGIELSQIIGKHCYEVLHRSDKPREDCPAFRFLKTGTEARGDLEEPWLGKIFDLTTSPLRDSSGALKGSVFVLRDITERRRVEELLQEGRKELQTIIDSVPALVFYKDKTNRLLRVNRAFSEAMGMPKKEIENRICSELWPETGEDYWLDDREVIESGRPKRNMIETMKTARGTRWLQIDKIPYLDEGGNVIGLIGFGIDITERKRAEEALRESEQHFRRFIENVPVGVYRTTPDGRVLMANSALLRMLGYKSWEELASRNLEGDSFEAGYPRSAFREQIEREGEVGGLEAAWKRRDGSVVFVRESARTFRADAGRVLYYDGIVEDVTERRRLEEELRQAQKMEAVGRLAGGVAHDFNNLLTIILGYSDLVLEKLSAGDGMRPPVEEIKKAAERAASLTRQLLAFSRKQMLQPHIVDLNSLLANVDEMLRRMIGEDIELVTHLPDGLGRVKADPGQIEQVIMNLAVNARDAMPQGGRLTLEAANVDLDSSRATSHEGVLPGHYVMIAMSDTGIGMDAETQAHIFEPFFTTKGQGKGTGLGLATTYGIVKQSEGHIWVYSEPGKGTTFRVYLPRVDQAVEVIAPTNVPGDELSRGCETILLVEDEEAVCSLVRGVLESRGYNVLKTKGANDALEIGERYKKQIHLLLTDVVMPQMSGRELAEHLAPLHPETKVLYMSGYTDHAVVHHGLLDPGTIFLQKPFTPDALARKVREVLDG
jgi:PAS domain S-box-containing protein